MKYNMKYVLLTVSEKNISEGIPKAYAFCPVALAYKDAGILFHSISPFYAIFGWLHSSHHHTKVMAAFIQDFDEGRPVKPHTFRVQVPS